MYFSETETKAIDDFCASNNAVVFCDQTSNFYGKYAMHMSLVFSQESWMSELRNVDLVIHIGEVTGDVYRMLPKKVWRVSEDGALRDSFDTLTDVFMMPEKAFFLKYTTSESKSEELLMACREEYDRLYSLIPDLPFSNIWLAKELSSKIPAGSEVQLGIYNSLRAWNFFKLPEGVTANCNVGGFGIDGGISSMMGSAMARPDKLFFGVFGDLVFFYDMNVMGNRHVGDNVRMLSLNEEIIAISQAGEESGNK